MNDPSHPTNAPIDSGIRWLEAESDPESAVSGLDRALVLVLLVIAGAGLGDLALDSGSRASLLHLVVEVVLIGGSLAGIVFLGLRWRATRVSLATAHRRLEAKQAEQQAWQAQAGRVLADMATAVDRQLGDWGLTPAEQDTARRLILGHSVRRIGRDTDRAEKTVRQHAVAAYRKSGLSGRAELAGFFLSGLLRPIPESGPLPGTENR
ncbi:MAG: helix-turn-helix transcriptional regulator [Gemmatimonadales bacterium]